MTRVALITGASGGLGQALVAEFLAGDWRVVAGFHHENFHPETDRLWPLRLDVTSRENVEEAVAQVTAGWERVDLLINNAGNTADGLVGQLSDEDWQRVLDVHLKGAFLCSQAVLRPMLRQRDGHILNIASFSARTGNRGQANYAAAKAGQLAPFQRAGLVWRRGMSVRESGPTGQWPGVKVEVVSIGFSVAGSSWYGIASEYT